MGLLRPLKEQPNLEGKQKWELDSQLQFHF